MHQDQAEHAMTEIALALAMSFFSLLVLALVSMGVSDAPKARPLTASMEAPDNTKAQPSQADQEEAVLVIYHQGRLLNAELGPLDPEQLDATRRTILALPPDLRFGEAMQARSRLEVSNLVVTPLNQEWLSALKEKNP